MSGAPRTAFTRRQSIAATAATTGLAATLSSSAALGAQSVPLKNAATMNTPDRDVRLDTPLKAIVQTKAGRVRGFWRNCIFAYKGLPYGEPIGGAQRFMAPRPVKVWDGVRDILGFGAVSPHPRRRAWGQQQTQFVYDWDDGYEGEDCLILNLWTSDLDPAGKRPAMVWIHGGGFTSVSSHELPSYDGENLAPRGVVLVSVNHRMGPLGFMDHSSIGGADYATSGNLRMLDLVLALEWVRDNIHVAPDRRTAKGRFRALASVAPKPNDPAEQGIQVGLYENEHVNQNGVWNIDKLNFKQLTVPYLEGWSAHSHFSDCAWPQADAPTAGYHAYPGAGVFAFPYPNPFTEQDIAS